MLHSTETLQEQVSGPLHACFGPTTKILTVESHDKEIHGLALCPGKVIKYIYHFQTGQLRTYDKLSIKKKRFPISSNKYK